MPLLETLPVVPGVTQWPVWGTTARVVTADPSRAEAARLLVADQLERIGQAASRFRPDSEVRSPLLAAGRVVEVSALLADLLTVALQAAQDTDGAVDPTVGEHLNRLGYDRDFVAIAHGPAVVHVIVRRTPSWRDVDLDGRLLQLPPGVTLDLGATAKAYAADLCAELVADQLGCGVLVALGGDIRVAGPAPGRGWTVLVQDGPGEPSSTIVLTGANAIATSSTQSRSWDRDGRRMHHIVEPLTGLPVVPVWRTASVAGPTCLQANVLSTAALVRGLDAVPLLRGRRVTARLVAADRTVTTLGGWPA